MDIWAGNKLALFIAFVVPGFILLKIYELQFPSSRKRPAQQLIDVIVYSTIYYAVFLLLIYVVEAFGYRTSYLDFKVGFYVIVLIIAPVCLGLLYAWLRKTKWLQTILPHPTGKPWDYVFQKRLPYWIIVSLKDGSRIGGLYYTDSFASSAPEAEQLYLQETWKMNANGGFERRRVDSAGIIIMASNIVTVELFMFNAIDGDQEMTDRKPITNDSDQARIIKKGYQPEPKNMPKGHEERGGYQPATSQNKSVKRPPPKKP